MAILGVASIVESEIDGDVHADLYESSLDHVRRRGFMSQSPFIQVTDRRAVASSCMLLNVLNSADAVNARATRPVRR